MLGLRLFTWLVGLLGQRTESRADERQLRRELLAYQRRQLIHQHIPEEHRVREAFGPRFEELLQLLVQHDAAGTGPAAPTNAYYPELTRTVIYQLGKAQTDEQLLTLLRQEQGLWFGSGSIDEQALEALAIDVQRWRQGAGL
ncbi:hypothetical protein EJV47_06425 [Hymenobacter gummosus]|uniref:Uncharacterized protein n=1 Tax=Hymenobacter gummosus TaxID=1776032 RepID=A0A431U511_9BACT|nr:hypothetical protein [Hymenobacter gummosus]RTQ51435.1 hypothetical protein EJV47_06425 [Hymenobacter gummosus]